MDASRRAWDSTRHELNDHENKMTSLGKEAKELRYEADVATSEFKSFKETLALLLSRGNNSLSQCDTREDSIKERIKNLQVDASENSTVRILNLDIKSRGGWSKC